MENETLITREAALKVGQEAVEIARRLFPRATERTFKPEHIKTIARAILDTQDRLRAVKVSFCKLVGDYTAALTMQGTIHLGYVSGRNKYKGDAFSYIIWRRYTKTKDAIDNTYTISFSVSRF